MHREQKMFFHARRLVPFRVLYLGVIFNGHVHSQHQPWTHLKLSTEGLELLESISLQNLSVFGNLCIVLLMQGSSGRMNKSSQERST